MILCLDFFVVRMKKDLAANMLELIGNPDLRARLATNALKFVADKGWETKKSEYLRTR